MNEWRKAFPIFQHRPDWIYLDSAATAHKPAIVLEAMQEFYAKDYATVHRAPYRASIEATDRYDAARNATRQFLHAAFTDEIVFTRGTTDSINLVARTFPFERGDEIWITEAEHHSNLVPWQMIAKEKGVVLRFFPILPDGSIDCSIRLTPKTKLVSVAHVSNVTGVIAPIAELSQAAHRVGAVFFVDGAQGAPHMPVDVQALDIDFYAFSGHKCYGPTGIGVLYGKRHLLAALPPLQGGGAMVDSVDLSSSTYQTPPLRFEAGTPMIAEAIGLHAALQFITDVGIKNAENYEADLCRIMQERLLSIPGLRIIGAHPNKCPIVTFTLEGVHPLDLSYYLDNQNIAIRTGQLCAAPLLRLFGCSSAARASLALYNTEEEIDHFAGVIREAAISLKTCNTTSLFKKES